MYLQGVTTFSLYILCAGSSNAAVRSQLGSAAARRLQQAALATIAFALRAAALRIYAVYTVYIPYTEGSIYCIQCGGRIPVRIVSARIRSGRPHCSRKAFSHRIRIQRSYAYFKPIPANLYLPGIFQGGQKWGQKSSRGSEVGVRICPGATWSDANSYTCLCPCNIPSPLPAPPLPTLLVVFHISLPQGQPILGAWLHRASNPGDMVAWGHWQHAWGR